MVKQVVEQNNFDSVLVVQYMGTKESYNYVPATMTYPDYFGYMGPMMGEPGYVQQNEEVQLQSRFFDARQGGKLIWTANTSTLDPTSADKMIPSVASKIVDRLQKDVLI